VYVQIHLTQDLKEKSSEEKKNEEKKLMEYDGKKEEEG
jgi:hypothetical protein